MILASTPVSSGPSTKCSRDGNEIPAAGTVVPMDPEEVLAVGRIRIDVGKIRHFVGKPFVRVSKIGDARQNDTGLAQTLKVPIVDRTVNNSLFQAQGHIMSPDVRTSPSTEVERKVSGAFSLSCFDKSSSWSTVTVLSKLVKMACTLITFFWQAMIIETEPSRPALGTNRQPNAPLCQLAAFFGLNFFSSLIAK